MFKVRIKKQNIVTNEAKFETMDLVQVWIDTEVLNNSFGKPKRELTEREALLEGLDLDDAIAIEDKEIMGELITYFTFPAEYVIEIEDITEDVANEELRRKSQLAIQLGMKIMAEIRYINEKKTLTLEQFQVLIADQDLDRIERLLWNGSFKTAKLAVQAYNGTAFTTEEKQTIIDMLDNAIQECG